jgi:rod shape-determining protein MreC
MIFTAPERGNLTLVEKVVRDSLTPVQDRFTFLLKGASGIIEHFAIVDSLLLESEDLNKQVGLLQWENNELREYKQEALRLRNLLGFKEANPQYELIEATVIARGPSNWYNTLILNRGTNAGVAKNMVVITPEGLIGRVVTVSKNTAEVLLITDREGPVGAIVFLQETRIPGVVEGMGDGSDTLIMKHIPYDAPVEEGQYVVTSGLGEIFPKGIRIGTIRTVDREAEPSGLQKYAIIYPDVDFNRLEEVFIIKKGAPISFLE